MHTFNIQALEFAKSHLEDIKQPQITTKIDVDVVVRLRDKEKRTFQEIAERLHCSRSQVFNLYKLAKDKHKPYKKRQ